MFDHVGLDVTDFGASQASYARALAPLGTTPLVGGLTKEQTGSQDVRGLGRDAEPSFWSGGAGGASAPKGELRVAFAAPDRATVDAFHAAALAAGGVDNGAPGPRPGDHPHHCGAYLLDPDGHDVEAVCHRPA